MKRLLSLTTVAILTAAMIGCAWSPWRRGAQCNTCDPGSTGSIYSSAPSAGYISEPLPGP